MNERIRELWNLSRNPSGRGHNEEKFALLIVKECTGIVQPYMSRWPEDCDLVVKIKQHFGVEE